MYLALFLGIPFLTALLIIKLAENRKRQKYDEFVKTVKAGAAKAVPGTLAFETVIAQMVDDDIHMAEGKSEAAGRSVAGGDTPSADKDAAANPLLAKYIVCYGERGMYIMKVPCPSRESMEVDPDSIIHISADMLQEVKFGPMGKVTFCFKDDGPHFAMAVTEYAVPLVMQPDASKNFKLYKENLPFFD